MGVRVGGCSSSGGRRAAVAIAGSLLAGGIWFGDAAGAVDDEVPGVELLLNCRGQMELGVWKYGLGIDNMRETDITGTIQGRKANGDLVTSGFEYGPYRAPAKTSSGFFGYNALEDGQIIVTVDGETAVETIAVDCLPNETTSTNSSTSTTSTSTTITTLLSSGTIPGVNVRLVCNMSGRGVLTVENSRTTAVSGEIRSTKNDQTSTLLTYNAPPNDISANVLPTSAEDSFLTVTVDGENAVVQRTLDCIPNEPSSTTTTTTTTVAPPSGPVTASLEAVLASAPLPSAARSALLEVLRMLRLLFGWLNL